MPTYTYACRKCANEQDVFHGISAKPRVKCEKCGGNCKRLMGKGAGLIFKGSGFYETDYKRSGEKVASNSNGESKSESKSDGKADAGSPKKADAKPSEKKAAAV